MAALKTKKNIQWEKAQQRIKVSPLVSRISGLVPQGKVGAVGLAFGESLFLRKLLMPVLVPLKLTCRTMLSPAGLRWRRSA